MKKKLTVKQLYAKKDKHYKAMQAINVQIEEAEKDTRIKRLSSYVGKFYKHKDHISDSYISLYYVVGIDKDGTRNHVFQVTKNGAGEDAWLSFETEDSMYDMGEQLPCTREEFMEIFNKVKKSMDVLS
jgi:hypothetical protein